ncbi:MAG: D-TA family PLP-dependent enzyme [Tissierella sp.]|nr:D-TA family PLP-dependent enzyme [Tissierella sp.]
MSNYTEVDTPALLIDKDQVLNNIRFMQDYSNQYSVHLRPHTKTHKMPYLAKLQIEAGAKGITVAKVGEAEAMAENGINDIFIANEIVGDIKLNRIKSLGRTIDISFGIDCVDHVKEIERIFEGEDKKAQVLVEIEVGENRSGVIEEEDFVSLLKFIKECKNVNLKGIFSHEGHSYGAKDIDELRSIFNESQIRTLKFANIAEELGFKLDVVSIGATPPSTHNLPIMKGITEIRPGTYILMDVSQGNALGTYDRCAASVLATIISRPTEERVIIDVGAKGITMQTRNKGICTTKGLGYIKGYGIYIDGVFDEHGIIYNKNFRDKVQIGDRVEVIPNHICPVCNLYDKAYLVSKGEIVEEVQVSGRGRLA